MSEKLKQFRFRDLRINVKLLILALLPILGLLYFAITDIVIRVGEFNEANEINRLTELFDAIGNYVHETQAERGLSVAFVVSEGTKFGPELRAQREVVDEQTQILRALVDRLRAENVGQEEELVERLEQPLTDILEVGIVRRGVDTLSVEDDRILEVYSEMHNNFFDAILFLPNFSRDPEVATRITALGMLLHEKDAVDRERAVVSEILEERGIGGEEKVDDFTVLFGLIEEQKSFAETFRDIASAEEIKLHDDLIVANPAIEEVASIEELIFEKRAEAGPGAEIEFGLTTEEWFEISTEEMNVLKAVENRISNDIRAATLAGATKARNELISFAAISAILAAVTLLLAILIVRSINSQVVNLTEVFGQIREGNYTSRAEVQTADDLGQMTGDLNAMLDNILTQIDGLTALFSEIGIGNFDARAEVLSDDPLGRLTVNMNSMLDNTMTLIQTQEERDALQASIQKLLEEVSDVAVGDLTVEAEVTTDATGAIADSFNFMIAQLREVISRVQDATLQVSSSANEIQTTAEHLSQGSESQANQIVNTSAAIDEMAISIQQVSENAAMSATVAEQALVNARQGTRAVQGTIDGMNRIRDQVQETSKRIKRLGESSQEIGEIVQLISDIADRTSILALNASIQAAMAGEAGRGFAVVAEEVERLAERATDATNQIANLVKTIQSETNETVAAMEESTQEVVRGSDVANQAGQALGEIETVSNRLAELIQSISLAAKQQARGSEAVVQSMGDIAEVTQQTAAGTKQAAISINNLALLADDLRGSVSAFKLPSSNGSNGQDI